MLICFLVGNILKLVRNVMWLPLPYALFLDLKKPFGHDPSALIDYSANSDNCVVRRASIKCKVIDS